MDFKNIKMTRAIQGRVLRLFNAAEIATVRIEQLTAEGNGDLAADIAAKMRQAAVKLNKAKPLLHAQTNRRAALIQANKLLNERYVTKLEIEVLSAHF